MNDSVCIYSWNGKRGLFIAWIFSTVLILNLMCSAQAINLLVVFWLLQSCVTSILWVTYLLIFPNFWLKFFSLLIFHNFPYYQSLFKTWIKLQNANQIFDIMLLVLQFTMNYVSVSTSWALEPRNRHHFFPIVRSSKMCDWLWSPQLLESVFFSPRVH